MKNNKTKIIIIILLCSAFVYLSSYLFPQFGLNTISGFIPTALKFKDIKWFIFLLVPYVLLVVALCAKFFYRSDYKKYVLYIYFPCLAISLIAILGFRKNSFYQFHLGIGDVIFSPHECNLAISEEVKNRCFFNSATDLFREEFCKKVIDSDKLSCYALVAEGKNMPDICKIYKEPDDCYLEIMPRIKIENKNFLEYCDKLEKTDNKDSCLHYFAQKHNNLESCNIAYKPGSEDYGFENCIIQSSLQQSDISICNKIDHSYRIHCVNRYTAEKNFNVSDCLTLLDSDIPQNLTEEYYYNACIESLIDKENDFKLCSEFKGTKNKLEKYNCLVDFAIKNNDIKICKNVDYYSPNHNEESCIKRYNKFKE